MTIQFSADDWARIRRDYTAWWRGELDRPLVHLANVTEDGRGRPSFPEFLTQFPPETRAEQIVERFIQAESPRLYPGDSFPSLFINFGPGVLAAFLGAHVQPLPETVWFSPAEGADLSNLRLELDTQGYWWRRVEEITRVAAERMGRTVQITMTDLGGNLDVLASLVGTERLLMELIDRPSLVQSACNRITQLWLEAYDRLDGVISRCCPGSVPWAPVWAPGRSYMFQSDLSYMISPDMFRQFVLPDLEACCERIEYSFYHLDGIGQIPHLDHLLGLEKLEGIQWIPGDGQPQAGAWPDLLRRIRDGGKLVQVYDSAEAARKICREVGGEGFLMVVWDAMTPAQAQAFLREIDALP